MSALEVQDLVWEVPARRILRGISLRVEAGEFVGLIGPNGGGKSSLLRCVYRLHRPRSGAVLLDGADIWSSSARDSARQTAAVLQELPMGFGLTVADVVSLGLTPHKSLLSRDNAADRQLIDGAIRRVGLDGFSDHSFDTLSGGEKQRCLIARALVQRPLLLILDEPINHLDIRYQRDVMRLTRSLGISVLASLHDLNQAAAYCNRLYMVADGQIAAEGSPAEVLKPDLIQEVFGVSAHVEQHPVGGMLRITYDL